MSSGSQHPPAAADSEQPPAVSSFLRLAAYMGLRKLSGLEAEAEASNFVCSPLSIHAALSLVAVGSRGRTLHQMLTFLGSPPVPGASAAEGIDRLNSAAGQIVDSVRPGDGGPLLSFVSGLWVDRSLTLDPSFKQIATSIYEAEARSVDFQNKAVEVKEEVNAWAEKQTKGLIRDLLPNGSVDRLTKLVLANALYFKGEWVEKFDRSATIDSEFHLLDGSSIEVPFMTSGKDQFASAFDGFKVLGIPYKRDRARQRIFSMYVFLPDEKDGLGKLLERVAADPSFVDRHLPERRVKVAELMVPRFKVSSDFEASDVLKELGLELPFSGEAELAGIVSSRTDGGIAGEEEKVYVSAVFHKATVEVEEEGTVAAAATAVVMLGCSMNFSASPPIEFVADHPFMFVVREDARGLILFHGHVTNPSMG